LPDANIPRDEFPTVLIFPVLAMLFEPPVALMASDPELPPVLTMPELLIVFEPPEALTPGVLTLVTLMTPVFVIVSVLLPFSVCVEVVLPVIVVSAAIALNWWVKMPAHVSALNKYDAECVFILANLIVVLCLIP
jgi:hypothetical protein